MSTQANASGMDAQVGEMRGTPVVFVSHGSPMVALEGGPYSQALEKFGGGVNPQAILVISAHWEESGDLRIAAAERPKLLYDFGGFPPSLSDLTYDAPGSPALAGQVQAALGESGIAAALDPERGWDHGVWIPLRLMFPKACVPVVQISLPMNSSPQQLFQIGEALARFRKQGVLILGSGGLVHNLRRIRPDSRDAPAQTWAVNFETWVREAIGRQDFSALFDYRRQAPKAALAVPSLEHFAPLFVVLGAAHPYARVVPIFEGFQYANMSMHCFALES